jgi:hypothetical protein
MVVSFISINLSFVIISKWYVFEATSSVISSYLSFPLSLALSSVKSSAISFVKSSVLFYFIS